MPNKTTISNPQAIHSQSQQPQTFHPTTRYQRTSTRRQMCKRYNFPQLKAESQQIFYIFHTTF